MPELVIRALHEHAVQAEHRLGTCARKARGVGHGMLLGNAHIHELGTRGIATGLGEAHDVGRGGGNAHHALIGGHTHEQMAAGDIRVGLTLLATAAAERLIRAGLDVKGAHVVPTLGVVLCGLVAGALDGAQMQDDRMVDIAQLEQGALDGRLVVAIGEEAIVEPQGAEEVVGGGAFALA